MKLKRIKNRKQFLVIFVLNIDDMKSLSIFKLVLKFLQKQVVNKSDISATKSINSHQLGSFSKSNKR